MLAFVAGKFDMTFPTDVTVPLLKNIKKPTRRTRNAPCATPASARNLIINRDTPPFDNPNIRTALALTLDRKSFIDILSEGQGKIGGAMLPPPDGVWGLPPEMLKDLPGYGDVAKSARGGARADAAGGLRPGQAAARSRSARATSPTFRDPAVILIDQLKQVYIDGELELIDTAVYYNRVFKKNYAVALNLTGSAVDDPDLALLRELCLRLAAQLQQLLRPGDDQAVRGAVARDRPREAPEDGVGDRPQAAGGHRAADRHLRPRRRLLAAARQERRRCTVNSIYNGWRFEDVRLEGGTSLDQSVPSNSTPSKYGMTRRSFSRC